MNDEHFRAGRDNAQLSSKVDQGPGEPCMHHDEVPEDGAASVFTAGATAVDDLWDELDERTADREASIPGFGLQADALLWACSTEAERMAEALARIDLAIAACIPRGHGAVGDATAGTASVSSLSMTLQEVDLLRQEAQGLARAMRLLSDATTCDGMIAAEHFAKAVPLGAQRCRLQAAQTKRDSSG